MDVKGRGRWADRAMRWDWPRATAGWANWSIWKQGNIVIEALKDVKVKDRLENKCNLV